MTALNNGDTAPNEFEKEIEQFSGHCAYIHSVYVLTTRIWKDSTEEERKLMDEAAPSFFSHLAQVLAEYVILSACRITDQAKTGRRENLTLETFVESFPANSQTATQLDGLRQRMQKLRDKIEPARNKIVAHADRDTIRADEPLGHATWAEWRDFWLALKEFVRLLNERALGSPFDIDVTGVYGDAEMVIKSFRQSDWFVRLLKDAAPAVRDACLEITAPAA